MPAGVQSDGFATGKQFLTDGAASRWNADNRTTVYADVPKFVRKASTVESGQGGQKTVVSVSLQIQGELDAHGVYTAVASGGAKPTISPSPKCVANGGSANCRQA